MTRLIGRVGATRAFLGPPTVCAVLAALATIVPAHHVGTYTPADNELTTNFKQVKFSVQAGKFDVALRLFDQGALRAEMRAKAAALPPGLEAGTRAALRAGDGAEVERRLMVFFAALARDLALEADRRLADPALAPGARAAVASRFLEAIWRYYNLIDFAVATRDDKTSVAVRLAFDEAEGYAKKAAAPEGAGLRGALRRIARVLAHLIDASSPSARRDS